MARRLALSLLLTLGATELPAQAGSFTGAVTLSPTLTLRRRDSVGHLRHAGAVQVFCHIHSDMSAVVLALENQFFLTPSTDGTFTLDGIPPGEYAVVGWHERVRPATHPVRVTAGAATRVNFNLPIPLPDASGGGRPPP